MLTCLFTKKKKLSNSIVFLSDTSILLPVNILENFTKLQLLSFRFFGNVLADELLVIVLVFFHTFSDSRGAKPPSNFYVTYLCSNHKMIFFVPRGLQSVIPLWKEMEYYKEYQEKLRGYLGNEKATEVIGEALYLMSIGTNDFLENYYVLPRRSSEYNIKEYQNFLAGIAKDFITELYRLGARNISLSGLPPMGCLPLERTTNMFSGSDCVQEFNDVAKEFNEKLQGTIMKLNKELPGIRLVFSNPYDILLDIIQNPEKFGKFSALFSYVIK